LQKAGDEMRRGHRKASENKTRVVELQAFRTKKRLDAWRQRRPQPRVFIYYVVVALFAVSALFAVMGYLPLAIAGKSIVWAVFLAIIGLAFGLGLYVGHYLRVWRMMGCLSVSLLVALLAGAIRFGVH